MRVKLTLLALAASLSLPGAAQATEHVYDLKTTTAGYWSQTAPIGGGLIQHVDVWNLVDATTGASTGAGFLLGPGDVVRGTIQLDHAWTPPNLAAPGRPDWFTFQLGNFAGTAYPVNDHVSIDYYLGGVLVTTSNPLLGGFGNRITAFPDDTAVIPATTFDSIKFSIEVAGIYDNTQGWGVPSQVDGNNGQLMLFDFAPAVPEPGTWALMLVGLVACGAARRRG